MNTKTKARTTQLTRRKLLQTATAAGLTVAVVPLMASNLNADKKKTAVADAGAFAPMALWLALTTNESFNTLDPSVIAKATGVSVAAATKFKQLVNNTQKQTFTLNNYADIFIQIRGHFQSLATDIGYSGGQCPKSLDTIAAVAALDHP